MAPNFVFGDLVTTIIHLSPILNNIFVFNPVLSFIHFVIVSTNNERNKLHFEIH